MNHKLDENSSDWPAPLWIPKNANFWFVVEQMHNLSPREINVICALKDDGYLNDYALFHYSRLDTDERKMLRDRLREFLEKNQDRIFDEPGVTTAAAMVLDEEAINGLKHLSDSDDESVSSRIQWRRTWASWLFMRNSSNVLKRPPGTDLLKMAEFFCARRTLTGMVMPLMADWRIEYFEALKDGRNLKARWISVRYRWAFVKTLGLGKVLELFKAVLFRAR